jgi:hypothetical protein
LIGMRLDGYEREVVYCEGIRMVAGLSWRCLAEVGGCIRGLAEHHTSGGGMVDLQMTITEWNCERRDKLELKSMYV